MKMLQNAGSFFLFITSIGALAAGFSLIADPSGNGVQLSLTYLIHSPFQNYLIPGLILFTVIGLFGLWVLVAIVKRMKNYEILQITYGTLLTGWIMVQMLMLQFTYYLQFIFGFIGVYLIDVEFYQTL
jgi:hypothetical protein